MGLTPHEYYCMTPAEYILMRRGYMMKKSKEWEQTRVISYTVAANAYGRKKSMPSIQRYMPLPSDRLYNSGISEATREKLKALREFKKKK